MIEARPETRPLVRCLTRRGFGLLETLMVVALFALIMVVIADLVVGYRNLVRHSQGRSRTLRGSQIALNQIRSDIRAAVEVVSPASGETSNLELKRISSSLSPRLPEVVPTKPPSSWNISDPSAQYPIDVQLEDDLLVRSVDGNKLALASGLSDFKVSVDGPQYEVTLQFQERTRTMNLVSRVSRL